MRSHGKGVYYFACISGPRREGQVSMYGIDLTKRTLF